MKISRPIIAATLLNRRRRRRAFTLIEMLVVISVIVIVLAIIVPSTARLMRSTNYASAVNAVTATLGRARAVAMESGRPSAVAFLFDIESKRYTLQVLELAPAGGAGAVDVEEPGFVPISANLNSSAVYQPLRFSAPIELPAGMGVFGLSQEIPEIDAVPRDINGVSPLDQDQDGRIDPVLQSPNGPVFDVQQWFAGEIINDGDNTTPDNEDNIVPWIFPRNDARLYLNTGDDPWRIMSGQQTTGILDDARAAVRNAMSFAISFRPDGSVSSAFGDSGLQDAYIEFPNRPLNDLLDPPTPYDDPNEFDAGKLNPTDPAETKPNPEVRLRTASLLAVVDLRSLQAGAGVNKPWLVRPASSLLPKPSDSSDPKIQFIDDDLAKNMSQWIDDNAQILGFNRYTGATVKR